MGIVKRAVLLACAAAVLTALCACGSEPDFERRLDGETRTPQTADLSRLQIGRNGWQYDAEHDVYWLADVAYCTAPRDAAHETLSVFVPGKYLRGEKRAGGAYTCSINYSAKVNGYTAATAPMLLAVNTKAYKEVTASAAYHDDAMGGFLRAGMVCVFPGMRRTDGENPGTAPWGVVDLKAAVRFLRLNMERLPGDPNRIFAFGTGEGGALSAVLGASGDSEDYLPYLNRIGAALYDQNKESLSDTVYGVMSWNPSAPPDTGDSAYEWLLGQYARDGSRDERLWTAELSQDLAASYAAQINAMKLTDGEGSRLTLEPARGGICTSGGYADALRTLLEKSLNRYLRNAKFPVLVKEDGIEISCRMAEAYINALDGGERWLSYDTDTKTVRISDLAGFAHRCASALKAVGAVDGLGREMPENQVFSVSGLGAMHFDAVLSALLAVNQGVYARYTGWSYTLPANSSFDLTKTDELGRSAKARTALYTPLYFLSRGGDGYGKSTPAREWRINCGVVENGTAAVDAMNLFLALRENAGVKKVKLTPVWKQRDARPENAGSGAGNFLSWVEDRCPPGE